MVTISRIITEYGKGQKNAAESLPVIVASDSPPLDVEVSNTLDMSGTLSLDDSTPLAVRIISAAQQREDKFPELFVYEEGVTESIDPPNAGETIVFVSILAQNLSDGDSSEFLLKDDATTPTNTWQIPAPDYSSGISEVYGGRAAVPWYDGKGVFFDFASSTAEHSVRIQYIVINSTTKAPI